MVWIVVVGLVLVAVLHSVLGDRKLLTPLFRRLGNPETFPPRAQRLVRWVWHMLTAAWILLAVLLACSIGTENEQAFVLATAVLCAFNGGACLYAAGPKHPGAIIFLLCLVVSIVKLTGVG